jgi:multidrug efflux pump subunit AcrB
MIGQLVSRGATVVLAALCVTVLGLMSYLRLPREAAPDVEIPFVMVTTPYPGVSPEDIESLITTPLENELAGVADLKKMSSTSAEGFSAITLEFEPEANVDEALQRVRDRVGVAEPQLPPEAEDTAVREISFSDFPIMIVTIAGDVDEEVLKQLGEDLQDRLEGVPGVLNATLSGGRERQIRVQIDPIRLEHYALGMGDVIGAIGEENVNIPGGDLQVGGASFLLRVPGEFHDPTEIEQVALKRRGDRPVFVRDVGRVVDGFAERQTYARMNGEPAVSIAVTKRTGANILQLSEDIKAVVADQATRWPDGVRFRALGDQSKMIRNMVSDLENGIITALLLVVGVLMFFMGVRNSLFVATSIPLAFLVSMLVIELLGMTLNMIVLFSLILALGMLVDNAIVIVENVYRHREEGASPVQAAIEGTREVAMAVTSSTATTVAAFLPLLFWTGLMGQFMGYMPKTVVIVLTASLVVAVGVLPLATARLMRARVRPELAGASTDTVADLLAGRNPIMRAYVRTLRASIRHRYLSAGIGVAVLVESVILYGAFNHGTEFFPETQPNRATISVKAPDGTDIEATDAIVRRVEAALAGEDNVDVYVAEVGVAGDATDPLSGSQSSANGARITIDFLPDAATAQGEDRVRIEPTQATIERIRRAIEVIPGAEISIEKERMGPPVGAPIAVEVSGDDYHAVGAHAATVRRDLAQVEGTAKLTDDYRVGRPEMRLRIDRGAAKRVGASTQAVASALRTAVAGTKASALRDGEDEYDIVVELDPRYRNDLQAVLAMRIPGREDTSPDTFAVPLSAVASYELVGGSGAIRHIDQDLVVTIEGEIAEGHNENAVRENVLGWLSEARHPPGLDARLGGANDEQKAAQDFLARAFLIAVFLVALVLVWQFNRFDLPLVILAAVVLSLVGVLWGLMLTGTAFGVIMTGLGVISLAGVVVNNAIVLLDYVEQLRARGANAHDALLRAGVARFRPVFLTAITTVLGLVPMAIGVSIDFKAMKIVTESQSTEWWGPMAVAVIFGLGFATVLTLVMVPTLYSILEDLRGIGVRVRASLAGRRVAVTPEARVHGFSAE